MPKVEAAKKNLPPLSKGAKTASNKPISLQKPDSSQILQKSNVKPTSRDMKKSQNLKNQTV